MKGQVERDLSKRAVRRSTHTHTHSLSLSLSPAHSHTHRKLKEKGMQMMHVTEALPCFTTYFPYRNVLSFMLGPMRVYPSMDFCE